MTTPAKQYVPHRRDSMTGFRSEMQKENALLHVRAASSIFEPCDARKARESA